MNPTISVVIPTYNNSQFPENLHKNIRYLKDCQVIVVNDNPQNSLEKQLDTLDIKLIQLKENRGFAGAVNSGIHSAHSDYILLLNDDVLLQDESFLHAVDDFKKDPKLFAVSFAQVERNNAIVGKNVLFWKNGFMQHSRVNENIAGENGWAEGGSAMFDAKKMMQLGGFDELFSPFYWEDIDLSY